MTATGRATLLLLCALTAATAVLNPTFAQPWAEAALNNQQASQVIPSLSALNPPCWATRAAANFADPVGRCYTAAVTARQYCVPGACSCKLSLQMHILHEQVKCRKSGICQEMNARYDYGDVMR